jgi:hypothetical protein
VCAWSVRGVIDICVAKCSLGEHFAAQLAIMGTECPAHE